MYRCEAVTVEGFIQQLAVAYVTKGYWFYVAGNIPPRKDPRTVDQKLISRYGIGISKWTRARRKRQGLANVQYLRLGYFYVLLATGGQHPFFAAEGKCVRDLRRVPLKAFGYAISYRGGATGAKGHPSVRIERKQYLEIKAYFETIAVHRTAATLTGELQELPFEPYAPVRRQLLTVLRAVNRRRRAAGFAPVPLSDLRLRRQPVRPFG